MNFLSVSACINLEPRNLRIRMQTRNLVCVGLWHTYIYTYTYPWILSILDLFLLAPFKGVVLTFVSILPTKSQILSSVHLAYHHRPKSAVLGARFPRVCLSSMPLPWFCSPQWALVILPAWICYPDRMQRMPRFKSHTYLFSDSVVGVGQRATQTLYM